MLARIPLAAPTAFVVNSAFVFNHTNSVEFAQQSIKISNVTILDLQWLRVLDSYLKSFIHLAIYKCFF